MYDKFRRDIITSAARKKKCRCDRVGMPSFAYVMERSQAMTEAPYNIDSHKYFTEQNYHVDMKTV